ncbi:MAG: tRNA (guanosine(46)-N7)-methyltransferase TrmB [Lachnospiraceae bacterium]|nr:tRNA (guanosine(46)-N7)-methyltransferase TrmB [Lachnospiraceae bacterium]
MRLKNIPRARGVIEDSHFTVKDPQDHKGNWKELFGNDHPIHLEIGTGKGKFLLQLAAEHPEINYIGIEKYSSVLLRAIEKLEEMELENILFIRCDAELINEYFAEDEISRIYLNFSDPWPKERHAKRRLPSRTFLARYDRILKKDGRIEFKTDNRILFDFAVGEVPGSAFEITQITYDLHADPVMNEGNIMTEYEEKFSALGNPICKYILQKVSQGDASADSLC